jgi:putative Mg2+ transporter-C (MgtC) family protein
MTLELQLLMLVRLMLAAFLTLVIGIDRERRDKSAGLRTHMLAGIGACLFTSIGAFSFTGGDPTRVAAGVVTGIGFLGGGVVFRGEDRVRDLTTAASIWTTAAIGATVGVGAWLLAIGATVLTWFILSILRRIEERTLHTKHQKP